MEYQDPLNKFSTGCGKDVGSFFSPSKIIIVYTSLKILFLMKQRLGLEAMLEYLAVYIHVIEKNNPKLKHAVTRALMLVDVEKVYKQAMDNKDCENE